MKNWWQIVKWYWRMAKMFRLQATINAVMGIMTVCLDFTFIFATKFCVDIATGKYADYSLRMATVMLVSIILVQLFVGFARRWVPAILGIKAQNRMQLRIFRHVLDSVWNGKRSRHSGDAVNRLEGDVREAVYIVTDILPTLLGLLLRVAGAFWFLYTMAPRLALSLIIIVPLFLALSRIYVDRMRKISREIRSMDSSIQGLLQESIQHHLVLKTLQRTRHVADRLGSMQSHLRHLVRCRTVYSSTSSAFVNLGFATGYLLTFLWGARGLHRGEITYGTMIAFIQLVGQIQGPFRDISKIVPVIISAFTAGERLMELEDAPLEKQGAPIYFNEGAGLRLSHVTYAYGENKRAVLHDLSFDFPPGSATAILGETGAGKTTLIRLLLGLLEPKSGSAVIYDTNRCEPISTLTRCNMVYVPQGNTLFSGTVRDNLLLARPDATEEELKEALHLACADFVMEMTEGLDTTLGEYGSGLSEGQAQRIGIARALLLRGSILLLDESTSALDVDTELRLLENITRWMSPNETLLFVTHRPAVVEFCNQKLVLSR